MAADPSHPALGDGASRVAILLSAYNGRSFLPDQLASIVRQTHVRWTLYWRDDGSTDGTADLLRDFAATTGQGRCVEVPGSGHLGVMASFFALLARAAGDEPDAVAFADQDDVWLPGKLARALASLAGAGADTPALYCARQVLVDKALCRLGLSARLHRRPSFAAALTQNIATGCTVLLNGPALRLVAASRPPPVTLHDWWSYLIVAGAGGALVVDETPVVLYRQHPGSLIGAPASTPRRALAALRRGPSVFMRVMRLHVAALAGQAVLLSPEARHQLDAVQRALAHGPIRRARALRHLGLRRQTWAENALFYAWFVLG